MRYLWCCRCMLWTCCSCISQYTSWYQLSVHLLSHFNCDEREDTSDEDEEILCVSCSRSKRSHLSVASDNILHCFHCTRVFTDREILEWHLKIDHSADVKPRWYVCRHCGKLFTRQADVSRHMQDRHCDFYSDKDSFSVSQVNDIIFNCEICGVLCVSSKYCVDHKSSAPVSSALTSSSKCIEHASLFPNCHSFQYTY
uniref:C2H2-type domain-containing protein n=1 Tax=Cacopsylla melanoneura TaxID=428564 RepID=A0A8D8QKA5_9HEMI